MSLKEWFEMGRQNEREHSRKQRIRKPKVRQGRNPPFLSPSTVVIGAGVVYEIVRPNLEGSIKIIDRLVAPVICSIKWDIRKITNRIYGEDKDFEVYRNFYELAMKK